MKRKSILLSFCIIGIIKILSAQVPMIQWQKTLGGTANDFASSIQQTVDAGYIVAGYTSSTDGDVTGFHGNSDCWLAKLDAAGNLSWQKAFGGSSLDQAVSVQQTSDGGYIVAATSYSNDGDVTGNHGISDCWIVKFTGQGNISWQKSLGGAGQESVSSIQQTADGGYLATGSNRYNDGDVSGNHGAADYWVMKLDATGNLTWQKSLGGSGDDFASSGKQTSDGGYILAGYTNSNNGDVTGNYGGYDYWVVKLNSTGGIQWQKCLGGAANDLAGAIEQTADGNYIVAGYSGSNDGNVTGHHGADDYWVVKLNTNGDLLWQKSLGGTGDDWARTIKQTADGGYIVAGETGSFNGDVTGWHGADDYWLVKLDMNGNVSWQKTLGGSNSDNARAIQQTNDGGYVVAGYSFSNNGDVTGNHGGLDYWIVKLAGACAAPTITASGPTSFCQGGSVTLSAGVGGNTWIEKASFGGGPVESAVGFSIGSKGYTGTGNNGSSCMSDFWEYDPAADFWTQKADFGGGPRESAVGFSIGTKGYIGTGYNGSSYHNDFWEYDPGTNSWTQKANVGGSSRAMAVGFSIGSKGYIGTGTNGGTKNDFWEYDPAADTWTQKANFGGGVRFMAAGFSIGPKGYLGTGYGDITQNDFWEYDPAADTWTQKANYGGEVKIRALGFSIGTKGYMGTGFSGPYGGRTSNTSAYGRENDFWEYDPGQDRWTKKADFGGSGRISATGFGIGNKGYIGTGFGNAEENDFWEYDPGNTYLWSPGGATTPAIHVTTTGSYSVTVTNASGCQATSAPVMVTVNPCTAIKFDPIWVSTSAGNAEAGFADGTGIAAKFNNPTGVIADGSGNIFVADRLNHRIRKIDPAGLVSTFAGSGVAGLADGMGTAAQFASPNALAIDATGNLYVSDGSNGRIRKITAAGLVTTMNGINGTAQFTAPSGVAIDADGNIYVAEIYNHRIRKIAADGQVTTFAGSGIPGNINGVGTDAQFWNPNNLAIDNYGNLYVSELNGGPRKITPSAVVTTIRPSDLYGFHYGIALDADASVFVSLIFGGDDSHIYQITPSGASHFVAGGAKGYQDGTGADARFNGAYGLAFDGAGNLYVADAGNNRIRKISPPTLNFNAEAGTASAAQFFSISGTHLSGNISITAPAGYEVSLNEISGYSSSLTVSPVSGEVSAVLIYTRLRANTGAGIYNGNISMSASGASTKLLPVTGIVTDSRPPVVQCPASQLFCFHTSSVYTIPAITATDISGIKMVQYSISGATNRNGAGLNASGIFNPGKSVITWTVTDSANNTATCTTPVRIDLPLSVSIPAAYPLAIWGKANTIYKGFGPACAILIASASGGTKFPYSQYHYSWSTGSTAAIISVCPAAIGSNTYTVTVTDSLGCTATASIVINVVDVRCGPNNNEVRVCWFGRYQSCYTQGQAVAALLLGAKLGSCAATTSRGNSDNNSDAVMNEDEIKIFPNPNDGTFVLQFNNTDAREIRILDMTGKIIDKKILDNVNRLQPIQMRPAKISNGIYLVQVLTKSGVLSKTIIVQK